MTKVQFLAEVRFFGGSPALGPSSVFRGSPVFGERLVFDKSSFDRSTVEAMSQSGTGQQNCRLFCLKRGNGFKGPAECYKKGSWGDGKFIIGVTSLDFAKCSKDFWPGRNQENSSSSRQNDFIKLITMLIVFVIFSWLSCFLL